MKYLFLLLCCIGCASAKIDSSTLTVTNKINKIVPYPKALVGWYKHNGYEESEADLLSSKIVAIELKPKGNFTAHLKFLDKNKNAYISNTINGKWSYGAEKTLTIKLPKATCLYTYNLKTAAEMQPIGKGLTRKFTEGSDVDTELCKYRFMACSNNECL